MILTQTELKQWLDYDPATGVWTWLQGQERGKRAGTISSDGYRIIALHKKKYRSARLAVLFMTGEWPVGVVDHRRAGREHRADDRWDNLRVVTVSQNNCNRTAGPLKGVQPRPSGRFTARVGRCNSTYLGTFDTVEAAADAVRQATKARYGEFAP